MLIKVATLFLIGMLILALFGKLRGPKPGPKLQNAQKCPECGAFLIGNGIHQCAGRK